jgi:hypothetical protein
MATTLGKGRVFVLGDRGCTNTWMATQDSSNFENFQAGKRPCCLALEPPVQGLPQGQ